MLTKLLTMTQEELHTYILKNIPEAIEVEGNILIQPKSKIKHKPILCAHMDTVSKIPPIPEDILQTGDIIHLHPDSASSVLGADDRAGVFILLELIKKGCTKYDYLICLDEEVGCLGSRAFTHSDYFDELKPSCFIGVDRRCTPGESEFATYDCDSEDLTKVLREQLPDFKSTYGTVSDCSELSMSSTTPCFNMTAGYQNEHTARETLHIPSMLKTLEALLELEIPDIQYEYEYVDRYASYSESYAELMEEKDGTVKVVCAECTAHALLYENPFTFEYVCKECLIDCYSYNTTIEEEYECEI